jgi:hypothetical protein
MEGLTRIELASSVWKTEALPLSYSPESDGVTSEFSSHSHREVNRRERLQGYYIGVTDPFTRVQAAHVFAARLLEVHPPDAGSRGRETAGSRQPGRSSAW